MTLGHERLGRTGLTWGKIGEWYLECFGVEQPSTDCSALNNSHHSLSDIRSCSKYVGLVVVSLRTPRVAGKSVPSLTGNLQPSQPAALASSLIQSLINPLSEQVHSAVRSVAGYWWSEATLTKWF